MKKLRKKSAQAQCPQADFFADSAEDSTG